MAGFENAPNRIIVERQDIKRVKEMFDMVVRSTSSEDIANITDMAERNLLRELDIELVDGGQMRPHIEELFALRRQRGLFMPTGYMLRQLELCLDKQLRKIYSWAKTPTGDVFPEHFIYPGAYHKNRAFEFIDYDELFVDMNGNLQSSIDRGYQIFKQLSYCMQDRLGPSPSVVDTGGSIGSGLLKWSLDEEFTFEPYKVLNTPNSGEPISPFLGIDKQNQELVNYISQVPSSFGRAVSYDVLPVNPQNQDAQELVFSHSYPFLESEADQGGVIDFWRLANSQSPKVRVLREMIDATDAESLTRLQSVLPGGKADIFIFSAMLFELSSPEVTAVLNNLREYCNPGALYFISDFAGVGPKSPNGLNFIRRNWWHRQGAFATFIMDPFDLAAPPVEVCRFLTRRCKSMYLTPTGKRIFQRAFA